MENKIEITEENYEMYKEFYYLKTTIWFIRKKYKPLFIIGLINIIIMLSSFCIILSRLLVEVLKDNSEVICGILGSIGMVLGCFGMGKVTSILTFKDFQKDYPNFDMNIDLKELEKELEKYRELSKVSKDFEDEKEEHLENFSEEFRTMSPDEKSAFLKRETEFWEQEKINQKYSNINEEEKGIQKKLEY